MFGFLGSDDRQDAGHLIVGDVTGGRAILWMKGAPKYAFAHIHLETIEPGLERHCLPSRVVELFADHDNIAVTTIEGLLANRSYGVTASFRTRNGSEAKGSASCEARATFKTAPDGLGGEQASFSFLLGSCNLSIVSINNLAARALQIAGLYTTKQSMRRSIDDRPIEGRAESKGKKFGRWWMKRKYRRRIVDKALELSVGAVFAGTDGKWPGQPLLRSPFLKLEALFAGQALHFHHGFKQPMPGDVIRGGRSGASGMLAFTPKLTSGGWRDPEEKAPDLQDGSGLSNAAKGALILVDVDQSFITGERLFIDKVKRAGKGPTDLGTVGYVIAETEVTSDYNPPDFTIHAGDQVYFDFPDVKRPPELARYHEAYREAWFEDRHQRAFLARGAHYMTLDDHEIVDQYSLDLEKPPSDWPSDGYTTADYSRDRYRKEAMDAYRHYVQQRQSQGETYFDIDYGKARFFFLDTRTERRHSPDPKNEKPNTQMIAPEQMKMLKAWLECGAKNHLDKPSFIVSSVPFIAEVRPDLGSENPDVRSNRSKDKWSGAPFRRQRDEIIELIWKCGIGNLAFLVGDMHCAYHASMTVGKGQRWQRLRIHELAGGPINQLQHGRRHQFAPAVRRTTRGQGIPYDVRLHQFHSGANAIMHIDVDSRTDAYLETNVPEIRWRVIRTMTEFDSGPWFDEQHGKQGFVEEAAPISGRIVMAPALPRDQKKGAP